MSTHPYIPLYVDDFEAATAHLSIEEDGVYSRLLRLCWRTPGCSLPVDSAWIARKIRVSAEVFERVGEPVLAEFFTVVRGRYVQRRLKREYDDISRKKNARKLAGKKGGEAKAQNAQEKSASIATVLPADTCAFPEPHPEPVREATASLSGAEPPKAAWESDQDFCLAWSLATDTMRRRSIRRQDAHAEWKRQAKQAGGPDVLVAAVRRYLAEDPDVKRTGGPGFHIWLKDGTWDLWTGAATAGLPLLAVTPFENAVVRAACVQAKSEEWARSYIDRCEWRAEDKAIICPNAHVVEKLEREVPELKRRGAQIILKSAAQPARSAA